MDLCSLLPGGGWNDTGMDRGDEDVIHCPGILCRVWTGLGGFFFLEAGEVEMWAVVSDLLFVEFRPSFCHLVLEGGVEKGPYGGGIILDVSKASGVWGVGVGSKDGAVDE